MNKIKSVWATNNQGSDWMKVGGDGVARIENESIEFESSLDFIFSAYDKNDNLLKTYINGNLTINYFKVDEKTKEVKR